MATQHWLLHSMRLILVALVLSACGYSAATQPRANATPAGTVVSAAPSGTVPPEKLIPKPQCVKLDSTLDRLAHDPNPALDVQRAAIGFQDGRVKVQISLATPSVDIKELARRYDLQVTSRAGELADAWVPVAQLCALAAAPEVSYVGPQTKPRISG